MQNWPVLGPSIRRLFGRQRRLFRGRRRPRIVHSAAACSGYDTTSERCDLHVSLWPPNISPTDRLQHRHRLKFYRPVYYLPMAELDVGPIFLTRLTSEVTQPDPTHNSHETGPDPARSIYARPLVLPSAAESFSLSTKWLFNSDANIIVSRATAFLSKQHDINVGINN